MNGKKITKLGFSGPRIKTALLAVELLDEKAKGNVLDGTASIGPVREL